jgi:adenylate cyclase
MAEARKIAAILVTDIVGYSRLASADEDRTLARLGALRSDLIDPTIAVQHGRIVKRTGDGSITEFRSVVNAARCAIEAQTGLIERSAELFLRVRFKARIPGIDRQTGRVLLEEAAQLRRALAGRSPGQCPNCRG